MYSSFINPEFIKRSFYPPYKPHPVDIGHIRLYEIMHNTSIWREYWAGSPLHGLRVNVYINKLADELCVLYEQIISTWDDYEYFIDHELPFLAWKQKKFI